MTRSITPAAAVAPTPTRENLKRLVLLRYLVVAVVAAALGAANGFLELDWAARPMLAGLAVLVLANVATQWRLRRGRPVGQGEFFLQLLLDVLVLTGLLVWSGGSQNPLVSLYLIPVVIAAALLPALHAWAMAALTVGCYTGLMWLPKEHAGHHGHASTAFDLHLTGMWLTFAFSAALIAFFVGRMAHSLRERDRHLAEAREEALRNERIVEIGTLAAGAAHELGTPLATMSLLAEELQEQVAKDPLAVRDLEDLRRQIGNCKRIITELLASAGQARAESGSPRPPDDYLREVLSRWHMMRPGVTFDYRWDAAGPLPDIMAEQTLSQALINLLNNAADASPDRIEVEGRCEGEDMVIEIRDRGPGLTPEALDRAGEPFFTTKAPGKGTGLGLFLASATIGRFGGTVQILNRENHGACTRVRIPLVSVMAGETP